MTLLRYLLTNLSHFFKVSCECFCQQTLRVWLYTADYKMEKSTQTSAKILTLTQVREIYEDYTLFDVCKTAYEIFIGLICSPYVYSHRAFYLLSTVSFSLQEYLHIDHVVIRALTRCHDSFERYSIDKRELRCYVLTFGTLNCHQHFIRRKNTTQSCNPQM